MNDITIIGNLTANPSSRMVNAANGAQLVCDMTVAVNRYAGKQKVTDYFRVTCWNKQANNAMKYLLKGSKVAVKGAVSTRAYMGNDGRPHASLEVAAEKIEYLSSRQGTETEQPVMPGGGEFAPIDDDELPF